MLRFVQRAAVAFFTRGGEILKDGEESVAKNPFKFDSNGADLRNVLTAVAACDEMPAHERLAVGVAVLTNLNTVKALIGKISSVATEPIEYAVILKMYAVLAHVMGKPHREDIVMWLLDCSQGAVGVDTGTGQPPPLGGARAVDVVAVVMSVVSALALSRRYDILGALFSDKGFRDVFVEAIGQQESAGLFGAFLDDCVEYLGESPVFHTLCELLLRAADGIASRYERLDMNSVQSVDHLLVACIYEFVNAHGDVDLVLESFSALAWIAAYLMRSSKDEEPAPVDYPVSVLLTRDAFYGNALLREAFPKIYARYCDDVCEALRFQLENCHFLHQGMILWFLLDLGAASHLVNFCRNTTGASRVVVSHLTRYVVENTPDWWISILPKKLLAAILVVGVLSSSDDCVDFRPTIKSAFNTIAHCLPDDSPDYCLIRTFLA